MSRTALVEATRGDRPLDLVIRGGQLLNVYTGEVYPADIGIYGDRVALVDRNGELGISAAHELDARGMIAIPGLIDTPIYGEGEHADAFKAKLGESVLFPRRLGVSEEFASLALELITNSYINAQDIRIDGGIRMPPK